MFRSKLSSKNEPLEGPEVRVVGGLRNRGKGVSFETVVKHEPLVVGAKLGKGVLFETVVKNDSELGKGVWFETVVKNARLEGLEGSFETGGRAFRSKLSSKNSLWRFVRNRGQGVSFGTVDKNKHVEGLEGRFVRSRRQK